MRITLLLISFLVAFSSSAQELSHKQILENLRIRIPELKGTEMTIDELILSPYGNLKQGTLNINGQQTIKFLLSEELSHLILLTGEPIDVSLSDDEITQELEEQDKQQQLVAEESHRALSRFADGKPFKGHPDAPITIYEFSDFQCSFCARARPVIDELLVKYPETIRFVYLHFPLDIHDWAKKASVAADCAARQDDSTFWLLHDNFFDYQRELTNETVLGRAASWLAETSVDIDQWEACATDPATASNQGVSMEIDISVATAKRFGLSGTPAFFVNGFLLNGAQPIEAFDEVIQRIQKNL
ncbi:MAG: thioredoxin domain-containing protein [Bacteroidetes bacterium]|nr:thioredoxin domain-containing protein [Bacteroidota bacterium]MCY4232214.1 thioredoxin domain-containing protein [Bacteroidota bacterium]